MLPERVIDAVTVASCIICPFPRKHIFVRLAHSLSGIPEVTALVSTCLPAVDGDVQHGYDETYM
jgi:hypothetical protein